MFLQKTLLLVCKGAPGVIAGRPDLHDLVQRVKQHGRPPYFWKLWTAPYVAAGAFFSRKMTPIFLEHVTKKNCQYFDIFCGFGQLLDFQVPRYRKSGLGRASTALPRAHPRPKPSPTQARFEISGNLEIHNLPKFYRFSLVTCSKKYRGHFSGEKKSACGDVGGRPGLPETLARLEFHLRGHRAWQIYLNAICQTTSGAIVHRAW